MSPEPTTVTDLARAAERHVAALCAVQPDRRPGSAGNEYATRYVETQLTALGWTATSRQFDCLDWYSNGGSLMVAGSTIEIVPSPYGHPICTSGPIRIASTLDELSAPDLGGSVLVLTGELTAGQLTPTNYPFYQNEQHGRVLHALRRAEPSAVIAITGQCPELCGAIDPFPLIEDGDFPIPTANIRPGDAQEILSHDGEIAEIHIHSDRRHSTARNIGAVSGPQDQRILVMAHIDSKPGTPGAVDNASGVVVVLLLAHLLADHTPDPPVGIELLWVNGEDNWAAPGEQAWLHDHRDELGAIELAINIDGAGYQHGTTSYSTYNVPPPIDAHIEAVCDPTPLEP
ncbi:MAG: M28 family peptidase, partial [Acidimicrobiia bacterium]|nr:M28 family peptidase [Acidimicrobiia bacterium]